MGLKIAIDGGPLKSGDSLRGIGVYVRELSMRLAGTEVVDLQKAHMSDFDMVHFTRFNPFRLSLPFIKPKSANFIVTVYDLIPLIYPKNYPPGIKGRFKWEINKILINNYADAIITISQTSKKDICRFVGVDPEKVHVTYLDAADIFTKLKPGDWKRKIEDKYNLPKVFCLYVGDLNYNKNVPNLIKACAKLGLPLVIAGVQAALLDKMDLNHPELKHLRDLDLANVQRLGFVPDEDLVKIYNLAKVYVQPSFYEGFSLPPLQAVKCGTPVALSKNQCHSEIFGSGALFFNPYDIDSMVQAIANPNKKVNLPRDYDWNASARKTAEIYKLLAKKSSP